MKKGRNNHSFATRLSRWVLLVLFIMMCALAFFMYSITKVLVVEIGANTVKGSMHATEEQIKGVLSETSVAVKNNIFYIEQNLSDPDKMQASVERIVRENDFIRSCGISFVKNYYPQKGPGYCPYAWRTDSMQVKTHQLTDLRRTRQQDTIDCLSAPLTRQTRKTGSHFGSRHLTGLHGDYSGQTGQCLPGRAVGVGRRS